MLLFFVLQDESKTNEDGNKFSKQKVMKLGFSTLFDSEYLGILKFIVYIKGLEETCRTLLDELRKPLPLQFDLC